MHLKKMGHSLLFPHAAIMLGLLPISAVLLICSAVFVGIDTPIAYVAYVLAAYTLTVYLLRIPHMVRRVRALRDGKRVTRRWMDDPLLRAQVLLYASFVWNTGYGSFQLWLGLYHGSYWYSSLAAYYISLAVMRFFLLRHKTGARPEERLRDELIRYRVCGWIFLFMNLALAAVIFLMVYRSRAVAHHEITTIAMATYTFTTLTLAIVGVIRFRKYKSPFLSASKKISLAASCVSILPLEATMLTTFGGDSMDFNTHRIFLGMTGVAIFAFIITMALYMIVQGTRRLKALPSPENTP